MKLLTMIGALLLCSSLSFAECTLNFNNTKEKELSHEIVTNLEAKGYIVASNKKELKQASFKYTYKVNTFKNDNSLFVFMKLRHVSGFEKNYEFMGSKNSYTVEAPHNLELKMEAKRANTIAERNRILAQINPASDIVINGSDPTTIVLEKLLPCATLLGN